MWTLLLGVRSSDVYAAWQESLFGTSLRWWIHYAYQVSGFGYFLYSVRMLLLTPSLHLTVHAM